ncbi:signal peptidase I [Oerskovia jenensis]|uniref:Signal peptidase I n=1 Tax=Oerskovia jenensis TaxID=162169 RepID=A0ABS2LEL9_9CELL|nr:signal peptidase I [Oerskovia jenensis]MBM7478870.1 signal peptidase [Oerskovia jenensis]
MKWLKRIGDAFLTLAAIAGVLGLVLFVGIQTGNLQSLVVVSGSMIPTYEVGDGIVSRRVPASTLEVGDVVSVFTREGVLVTHRIVQVDDGPGEARTLTLRGDNNPVDDPEPYVVEDALVPMVRIPGARDAIEVLRRPTVGIPVVVAACALVGFALMPSSKKRPAREEDAEESGTSAEPDGDGPPSDLPGGDGPSNAGADGGAAGAGHVDAPGVPGSGR